MSLHYLAGSLDAVADAEEDDEPGEKKRQAEVPLHLAHVVDTVTDVEHLPPEAQQRVADADTGDPASTATSS